MDAVTAAIDEEEQVTGWRRQQLEQAGYPPPEADQLARSDDVDLHRAVELVRGGCPAETAVRILL